jgi:ABC-type proline/glycine betaine transport system permease subunit
MSNLERTEQDAILLHIIFAVIALLTLSLLSGIPVGLRLYGLVILYNIMVPVIALVRRNPEWAMLWLFLFPLSIMQIFPDWFLSSEIGIIIFPDTGSPRIGDVPVFMGGLWTIPLFVIVFLGRRIEARFTRNIALVAVCVSSAVLFIGSEATLWLIPIWYAQGVTVIFHVAVYLIVPEILLGLSAFLAYEMSHLRPLWYRLAAAFTVMILYLGNLCFFYLVIEHTILG